MSIYDDVQLKCTFPGCGTRLAQNGAWLPNLSAVSTALEGRPVEVKDLGNFVLCSKHGRDCREEGVHTYAFTATLARLETKATENAARAATRAATEAQLTKQKEADAKKLAEARARKQEFFGRFKGGGTPAPSSSTDAQSPGPTRPKKPEPKARGAATS